MQNPIKYRCRSSIQRSFTVIVCVLLLQLILPRQTDIILSSQHSNSHCLAESRNSAVHTGAVETTACSQTDTACQPAPCCSGKDAGDVGDADCGESGDCEADCTNCCTHPPVQSLLTFIDFPGLPPVLSLCTLPVKPLLPGLNPPPFLPPRA